MTDALLDKMAAAPESEIPARLQTPFQRFLSDFFESKVAMVATVVLGAIIFIAVFMFLAQPTATHAISRAAFGCNVQPWTKDRGGEK